MRILIAEDDATSRMVLEIVLRKWGYEVVSTVDGAAAWAVLQGTDAPKIAVLDWMMPEIDGVEVCRRVRQIETSTPPYIILLTALDRKEDTVQGLEAGANDYVTKPFDAEELRARVGVGCRVVELQVQLAEKVSELERSLAEVKTLQGILPICMHCHKIRNDDQAWQCIEIYIGEHSDAQFSHSLCPECLEKHYPQDSDIAGRPSG